MNGRVKNGFMVTYTSLRGQISEHSALKKVDDIKLIYTCPICIKDIKSIDTTELFFVQDSTKPYVCSGCECFICNECIVKGLVTNYSCANCGVAWNNASNATWKDSNKRKRSSSSRRTDSDDETESI
jgi:hypothetical protein